MGSADARQSPHQAARALPAPDAGGGRGGRGRALDEAKGGGGEGEEPGERALVCK